MPTGEGRARAEQNNIQISCQGDGKPGGSFSDRALREEKQEGGK